MMDSIIIEDAKIFNYRSENGKLEVYELKKNKAVLLKLFFTQMGMKII